MKPLVYKLGDGPKSLRWDAVIIRLACWAGRRESVYIVQNRVIARAVAGKYRNGHVIILK